MDRDAIARAQRRRQATEALDFERERTTGLLEQIDDIVAELEGPRIDEEALAKLTPEDAALARSILHPDGPEGPEEDWLVYGEDAPEDEQGEDRAQTAEAEIARLEEEITESRRRQEALERYLAALGD